MTSLKEIDQKIQSGDYPTAIDVLDRMLHTGRHAKIEELWLRFTLLLAIVRGNVKQAKNASPRYKKLIEEEFKEYWHLGLTAISVVTKGEGLRDLHTAFESFCQRKPELPQSVIPGLLRVFEDSIIKERSAGEPIQSYDYSQNCWSQWLAGLELCAQSKYAEAIECLEDSMKRYKTANRLDDVLWSCFDAILACLMADDPNRANQLFFEHFDHPSKIEGLYRDVAKLILEAYTEWSLDKGERARLLVAKRFEHHSKPFNSSSYPRIFAKFEDKIASKLSQRQTLGRMGTSIRNEKKKPAGYRMLVAKPVVGEEVIDSLCRIAAHVNVGNTRPNEVKEQVGISNDTLSKIVPWKQGLVFFVTKAYCADNHPTVVGSSKIQSLVNACWSREKRKRIAHRIKIVEYDVLEFDNSNSCGLELAGNAVLPEFRDQGIGKFHTQTRLLFVLMHNHDIPKEFTRLYADLLSPDSDGSYPFYEHFVRPLFNGYTYDAADQLRYSDEEHLIAWLGRSDREQVRHDGPVQLPLHALPKEIRDKLGTVRDQTAPAQIVLEKYGFTVSNKYDLLDGGQYYTIEIEDLKRMSLVRDLKLDTEESENINDAPFFTFAPTKRLLSDFMSIRCPAVIDKVKLKVPRRACIAAGLNAGEDVKVFMEPDGKSK